MSWCDHDRADAAIGDRAVGSLQQGPAPAVNRAKELHRCFAEFTLSEVERSFPRDCGIRMTANGLSMVRITTGVLAF
jgi:hypothetical protein